MNGVLHKKTFTLAIIENHSPNTLIKSYDTNQDSFCHSFKLAFNCCVYRNPSTEKMSPLHQDFQRHKEFVGNIEHA